MAAKLRKQLQTEVDLVHGSYGEFKVLVDGEVAIDAGALAMLGILPTRRKIVEAVKARLEA